MAGERHHYIPQFLQRGFTSVRKKEGYCWVFRRDGECFNSNTKGIGVERFFYSFGKEGDIDNSITEFESLIGEDFPRWKSGHIDSGDVLRIAELLAHLEIRGDHFRRNSDQTFGEVSRKLVQLLCDREKLSVLVARIIDADSKIFRKAMNDAAAQSGISIGQLMSFFQSSPSKMEALKRATVEGICTSMEQSSEEFVQLAGQIIRNAQLKVLQSSLAPPVRVEWYKNLHYSVRQVGVKIPLGDSMVIFNVDGGRGYKPILEKGDKLLAVLLPLTPFSVLVGCASESYVIDEVRLPTEIARMSSSFFVSLDNDEAMRLLSKEIGLNSHWLSEREIEDIFLEGISSALCS